LGDVDSVAWPDCLSLSGDSSAVSIVVYAAEFALGLVVVLWATPRRRRSLAASS